METNNVSSIYFIKQTGDLETDVEIINNNNDDIYIAHFHMLNALYNTLRGT